MRFTVLTLFPELIQTVVRTSITGRAIQKGVLSVDTINIRDYSIHGSKRVDDYPYGGGAGMVMEAEPIFQAVRAAQERAGHETRVLYLTPQAPVLDQTMVESYAQESDLILLCGHYEGIDERVLEEVVTDTVSIGDYVLTGGELAATVLIDAVSRFVPGVLHNEESSRFESLQDNLLEYPHFTRPEVWHEKKVPEVLLSGDHEKIDEWRHAQSLERTRARRPDLLQKHFPVTTIWFGEETVEERASRLHQALSCYGCVLNYNHRRQQKAGRTFSEKELLVLVLPEDPEREMSISERFQNLYGEQTRLILVQTAVGKNISKVQDFFAAHAFSMFFHIAAEELSSESDFARKALEIRTLMMAKSAFSSGT